MTVPTLSEISSKVDARSFALIYAVDSAARALTATVIPLHAYQTFKAIAAEQADSLVSTTYTFVSLTSFAVTFLAPWAIHRLGNRRMFVVAILCCVLGMIALSTAAVMGLLGGMIGRAVSGSLGSICLILFIIDNIPKAELVRAETLRYSVSAMAWGAGPFIGVWLYESFGVIAPALISAATHLFLIAYFRSLPISDPRSAAPHISHNPARIIWHFIRQKRLRLSWLLVFGRSAWWSMFFTYPGLYLTDQGADRLWAGAMVSAGNFLLILSPLVRRIAHRVGIKKPIVAAFVAGGCLTLLAASFYDLPALACGGLLLAACFIVALDSLANIPFMRFVRPRERPQMTTVFRTYVDISDLLPSAIYAILLVFFNFQAVFITSGLLTLVMGVVAMGLPRRL